MPFGFLRGVPRSGMMDAVVTVHPDWTRRDDPFVPADWHAPHVDVEYVLPGSNRSLPGRAEPVTDSALTRSGRVYGEAFDLHVPRSPQALQHDITHAPRDVDHVGDDEPQPAKDKWLTWAYVHPYRTVCLDVLDMAPATTTINNARRTHPRRSGREWGESPQAQSINCGHHDPEGEISLGPTEGTFPFRSAITFTRFADNTKVTFSDIAVASPCRAPRPPRPPRSTGTPQPPITLLTFLPLPGNIMTDGLPLPVISG